MKNKIILGISAIVILGSILFILTGCDNNNSIINQNINQGQINNNNIKVADHKIYKYAKITLSHSMANEIYYKTDYLFDDSGDISYGNDTYHPTFIFEFDTTTGKAIKATMYLFYLDYAPSTEWVDKSIDKYNQASASYKKNILGVDKKVVNEHITCLVANIDVTTSNFEQKVKHDILEYQDFNKYREDYLDMYTDEPTHIYEEGLFQIFDTKVEWSDNELKPF